MKFIIPPFQAEFFNRAKNRLSEEWQRFFLKWQQQIVVIFDAFYVITRANPLLPNATDLGSLTTGLLKSTVSLAVSTISIAVAGVDYSAFAFKTIQVSGQSDIVADDPADTLTIAAGTGITLTTNAGTDTLTIASTASPSSGGIDNALMLMGG